MSKLRTIKDFPKPGVLFRDITSWFEDTECVRELRYSLTNLFINRAIYPDKLFCIEARGFITGAMAADRLHIPMILVRKAGKLPIPTVKVSYEKEYGKDTLEFPVDSIREGDHVVIHDDILATGGTALAVYNAVMQFKPSKVTFVFLAELSEEGLEGRKVLEDTGCNVYSLYKV